MRFFTIFNGGLGCIILFGFDTIQDFEDDGFCRKKISAYFEKNLKSIRKCIMREKGYEEYEALLRNKNICNRLNLLFYYQFGKVLEINRNPQQSITGKNKFTLAEYNVNKVYEFFKDIIQDMEGEDVIRQVQFDDEILTADYTFRITPENYDIQRLRSILAK